MSGRYMKLGPGRYRLAVSGGQGPAGVHRNAGGEIRVGIDGGEVEFEVGSEEEVYYWWRGPRERPGVRLTGDPVALPADEVAPRGGEEAGWATDMRA